MLKKHTTWIVVASLFQLLTGLIHSIGLFNEMQGQNETENKMLDLMNNHQMDMGAGMFHSMMDLFLALSSCFTFMYLMGGINNLFLLRRLNHSDLKQYLLINIVLFGTCFFVMLFMTFLPPIVLTGLVFLFLLLSYFTVPKTA
jgi:hypothetical protein